MWLAENSPPWCMCTRLKGSRLAASRPRLDLMLQARPMLYQETWIFVDSIMCDSVAHVRRLDCSGLASGALLCTGVSPTATCGFRVFTTSGTDTCLSIRTAFGSNGAPIPFSLFGALNNGAFMALVGAEAVGHHEHGTRASERSVSNHA